MTMNLNELSKVEHVLVIVDHFMRYTRAYVTKDQKALTAAETLYKGFISIFGAPKRILMDKGKVDTLATCSATVNIYCLRHIVDFIVLLLFGTGCVDGSGSLSGGAFNQLKLVTLSIV